eukprot:jgi/Tetstr1/420472/TSEL_011585.t1
MTTPCLVVHPRGRTLGKSPMMHLGRPSGANTSPFARSSCSWMPSTTRSSSCERWKSRDTTRAYSSMAAAALLSRRERRGGSGSGSGSGGGGLPASAARPACLAALTARSAAAREISPRATRASASARSWRSVSSNAARSSWRWSRWMRSKRTRCLRRSCARAGKNQKVDLLGAKVVYHDPKKTKMPSLWEETEEKLHLEKK